MNDIFEQNHPMKDDKEFITSYWTDRAHDFGTLRAKELESPKLKLWRDELTSHIFDSDRSLRILDIGCGAGFFSIILSQLGHTVHGIDITPNMIDEANQLAESLDCDATFLSLIHILSICTLSNRCINRLSIGNHRRLHCLEACKNWLELVD